MNDSTTQDGYNVERKSFELPVKHANNKEDGSQTGDVITLSGLPETAHTEVLLSNPELSGSLPQQNPGQQQTNVVTQNTQQDLVLANDSTSQQSTGTSAVNITADDVDLIEKEWVEKAKSIVTKTFNDPYLQNKAFGSLRSEYMKKRFGKTLKTEE